MSNRQSSTGAWVVAVIVVVAVLAAGGYMVYRAMHPAASSVPAGVVPTSTVASAPAAIRHPIAQASVPASASTAPLPPLASSDASVLSALDALAGGKELASLLVPRQIITRIVATVIALPQRSMGRSILPMRAPAGSFAVATRSDGSTVMAASDARRYAPYVQAAQAVDVKGLVDWYVHAYPLFQQAYRDLGYPHGYFNDRLIATIDNLLATPELSQSAGLVQVNQNYQYVDPNLESLSVGQKMLLRAGPAGEAAIKAKLRAVRAQLTGRDLSPAAASTAP